MFVNPLVGSSLRLLATAFGTISASCSLIIYNRWVLKDCSTATNPSACRGFGLPYPFLLTFTHMVCISLIAFILVDGFKIVPRPTLNRTLYLRSILPFSLLVSADIALSNLGFIYLEASFIEMIKSSAPIAILSVSFLFGLETFSWSLVAIVAVISAGLAVASVGEANFHPKGFAVVVVATFLSALRVVLSQILTQRTPPADEPPPPPSKADAAAVEEGVATGETAAATMTTHKNLSPLQIIYVQAPLSAGLLVPVAAYSVYFDLPGSRLVNDWDFMVTATGVVIAGVFIAFALDVLNLLLVKLSSALTSSVVGVVKTIIVIALSFAIFRNELTALNIGGYAVCLVGVGMYNVFKLRRAIATT